MLAPQGTAQEKAKLQQASTPFEPPIATRQLPPLPAPANWRDVLHWAFLANGTLESDYFAWKAALANVDVAATWPNSNATVSFGYLFSSGNMKAWDRTSISGGFDPSVPLRLPIKTRLAGKVALETARAAGDQFRTAKFGLQRQVLLGYLDLALTEEKIRIEQDNLDVLKLLTESAAYRSQTGGPLQDLLKAQVEQRLAQNELLTLRSTAAAQRGNLNGLLGRDAGATLVLPSSLPSPRPVDADDARLIAVAVDQNPELAGLARQVAGRKDALELAQLAYLPDITPSAGFTGTIAQTIGAMIMLPTTLPAIRATIDQAAAMQRSAEAIERQTKHDRAASFVANLYLMRNAERQTQFYNQSVIPAARQLLNTSRQEYGAGAVNFADLIDSERTYIAVRLLVAESRIDREKRLADLEALAGVDMEMLGHSEAPARQHALPTSATSPLPQGGRSTS
ncbi:MAG TPA: TolC family protein [Rhodopila sp.]|nr:TolC family protein [Rhodopila sp.]